MLLVFQFPIADVRSFFKDSRKTKLSLNANSDHEQFIRGFGIEGDLSNRFTDNERKLRNLWLDSNAFTHYTAKRGLSFACETKRNNARHEVSINKNIFCKKNIFDLRVAFRHFCFLKNHTGCNAIGRFEIGFFMKFSSNIVDIQQIHQACSALANLKTRQYEINFTFGPIKATRTACYRPLIQSPRNIAKYFCASTTRIKEKITGKALKNPKTLKRSNSRPYEEYVKAGEPFFFATLEEGERFLSPRRNDFPGEKIKNTIWYYDEVSVSNQAHVKLYVLEENGKEKFGRKNEIHQSLAKIHIEYQGMKLLTNLMEKHYDRDSTPYSSGMKGFQELKNSVGRNISTTLKKISERCDTVAVNYICDSNLRDSAKLLLKTMAYIDKDIVDAEKKEIIRMENPQPVNQIDISKATIGTIIAPHNTGGDVIIGNVDVTHGKAEKNPLSRLLMALWNMLRKWFHC